jgi:ferritin-like metal-binding protein YciE
MDLHIFFECNGMTQANYCQSVRDAGLMAGARRIEHYETAAYGTARAFALLLQDRQSAAQLKRTLKEESTAFKLLL